MSKLQKKMMINLIYLELWKVMVNKVGIQTPDRILNNQHKSGYGMVQICNGLQISIKIYASP